MIRRPIHNFKLNKYALKSNMYYDPNMYVDYNWSPREHRYFPIVVQDKIIFMYWCLKQSSGKLYTPKEIIFRIFNRISVPHEEFAESKKLHKLLEHIDNNTPINYYINPYTCNWWHHKKIKGY